MKNIISTKHINIFNTFVINILRVIDADIGVVQSFSYTNDLETVSRYILKILNLFPVSFRYHVDGFHQRIVSIQQQNSIETEFVLTDAFRKKAPW